MRDLRSAAYQKAKDYMKSHNKEHRWNYMSNKEKILFTYLRSINEQILSRTKLKPVRSC